MGIDFPLLCASLAFPERTPHGVESGPRRWSIEEISSRAQRLSEFFRRLAQRLPAASVDEALAVLTTTLNEVEDELSGIRYNPERWQTDGRLYPPLPDSRRPVPGRPDVTRWRSKGHNTYIRENGAMEIVTVREGEIVFRAAGRNGRGVWDD